MESAMASVENPNCAAWPLSFGQGEIGEAIPDSDVCGKRKRGAPIDEIPKTDSAAAKPKERAKASRQVSEFEDTFELFRIFHQNLLVESEEFEAISDQVYSDDEDYIAEWIREQPFDRAAVLRYLKQVRQTFAFDVDVNIPLWLEELRLFVPIRLERPSFVRDIVYKAANLAIDEINADMNSKSYELVEIVKCVMTTNNLCLLLLTLNVKKVGDDAALVPIQAIVSNPIAGHGPMELLQWRFKPTAPAQEA